MNLIPQFQTLPLHICHKIISMAPYPGILESHKNCMDQLINIRECLHDYKLGRCADGNRYRQWDKFTYQRFALYKNRAKKYINSSSVPEHY